MKYAKHVKEQKQNQETTLSSAINVMEKEKYMSKDITLTLDLSA